MVEDNKADEYLTRQAMAAANVLAEIHVVNDGEKAFRFIDQAEADDATLCPVLVLLDLNLPKRTGAEVLQHLRQSRKFANAPVVVVTSSDSENDQRETARLGANGYFRKPSSYAAYLEIGALARDILEAAPHAETEWSDPHGAGTH